MGKYQPGDVVRAHVWREATVTDIDINTGQVAVSVGSKGRTTDAVAPEQLTMVKPARPPLPPVGAVVVGSRQMELFRHDPGNNPSLPFVRLSNGVRASWDTICTAQGGGRHTPQVYIPYNPEPVVAAYIDKEGDLWQPEGGGSNVLYLESGLNGKREYKHSYVEQHYGPLTPLVIDPTYKEPNE